ncbi:DUF1361 domain-containing protein [Flagellimonas onchidii]|uniref:DUF1361 domain-containing protein n=1 Tax=Flagellimonas onchidii TaxID=2562684 RepID=UPI0010A66374|nr:DUF1361 domain-containing protein [Allomuricauda onchidii]
MFRIQHLFRFVLHSYYPLILSLAFVAFLLSLRILVTGTFFYSFLAWNLFLATIPYVISQMALFYNIVRVRKHLRFIVFALWLAFLPNAPYIITDIIHLHNIHSSWPWFDLFMVFAFACNGLLLFVLSLADVVELLSSAVSKKWIQFLVFCICILSGFGIYLGRFLRFNSWDLLFKPEHLFLEVLGSLTYPYAYLMTFSFGLFLWIIFSIFNWIKQ